jgi:hypothetical protein
MNEQLFSLDNIEIVWYLSVWQGFQVNFVISDSATIFILLFEQFLSNGCSDDFS